MAVPAAAHSWAPGSPSMAPRSGQHWIAAGAEGSTKEGNHRSQQFPHRNTGMLDAAVALRFSTVPAETLANGPMGMHVAFDGHHHPWQWDPACSGARDPAGIPQRVQWYCISDWQARYIGPSAGFSRRVCEDDDMVRIYFYVRFKSQVICKEIERYRAGKGITTLASYPLLLLLLLSTPTEPATTHLPQPPPRRAGPPLILLASSQTVENPPRALSHCLLRAFRLWEVLRESGRAGWSASSSTYPDSGTRVIGC